MSQFQPMKTSTLIICQVLPENILDEVYEILLNFHLKCIVVHVVEIYTSMMMYGRCS